MSKTRAKRADLLAQLKAACRAAWRFRRALRQVYGPGQVHDDEVIFHVRLAFSAWLAAEQFAGGVLPDPDVTPLAISPDEEDRLTDGGDPARVTEFEAAVRRLLEKGRPAPGAPSAGTGSGRPE
jgi:hypothetical protein